MTPIAGSRWSAVWSRGTVVGSADSPMGIIAWRLKLLLLSFLLSLDAAGCGARSGGERPDSSPTPRVPLSPPITVLSSTQGITRGETVYRMADGPNEGILRYDETGKTLRFSFRHNSGRPAEPGVPIERKMALLRQLLERFFADRGRAESYSFGIGGYREMGPRLAAAAARSSLWDSETGRPRRGSLPEAVTRLFNESRAYSELARLVEELGYELRVSAVEKVVVVRVRDLDESTRASLGMGVPPDARLPFSAETYFTMERKGSR
jgi:hypothetical protein